MKFLRQLLTMFLVVGCTLVLVFPDPNSLGHSNDASYQSFMWATYLLGDHPGLQFWMMLSALFCLGTQEFLLRDDGAYGGLSKSYRFHMVLHVVPCVLVWVLINVAGGFSIPNSFDGPFLVFYVFNSNASVPHIFIFYLFVYKLYLKF